MWLVAPRLDSTVLRDFYTLATLHFRTFLSSRKVPSVRAAVEWLPLLPLGSSVARSFMTPACTYRWLPIQNPGWVCLIGHMPRSHAHAFITRESGKVSLTFSGSVVEGWL